MTTGRLEAFSDGVFAIIITVMVLELKVPVGDGPAALRPLVPALAAYVVSFVYVGIYWDNHHHLFQAADRVTGGVLWANLHLLFWLSLVPLVTEWVGQHHAAPWPAAAYGVALLLSPLCGALLDALGQRYLDAWVAVFAVAGMVANYRLMVSWRRRGGDDRYVAPEVPALPAGAAHE